MVDPIGLRSVGAPVGASIRIGKFGVLVRLIKGAYQYDSLSEKGFQKDWGFPSNRRVFGSSNFSKGNTSI